jgi:hypothetical protein
MIDLISSSKSGVASDEWGVGEIQILHHLQQGFWK